MQHGLARPRDASKSRLHTQTLRSSRAPHVRLKTIGHGTCCPYPDTSLPSAGYRVLAFSTRLHASSVVPSQVACCSIQRPMIGCSLLVRLLLHDNQVPRRCPEPRRVRNPEIATERVLLAVTHGRMVETLPRDDLVAPGAVRHHDGLHASEIAGRKCLRIRRARALQRVSRMRDEEIRATLAHHPAPLHQLVLAPDDVVHRVVLRLDA